MPGGRGGAGRAGQGVPGRDWRPRRNLLPSICRVSRTARQEHWENIAEHCACRDLLRRGMHLHLRGWACMRLSLCHRRTALLIDPAHHCLRASPGCRQRGLRVIGETVASALAGDESALWDPDFDRAAQFVMSPPIRSK